MGKNRPWGEKSFPANFLVFLMNFQFTNRQKKKQNRQRFPLITITFPRHTFVIWFANHFRKCQEHVIIKVVFLATIDKRRKLLKNWWIRNLAWARNSETPARRQWFIHNNTNQRIISECLRFVEFFFGCGFWRSSSWLLVYFGYAGPFTRQYKNHFKVKVIVMFFLSRAECFFRHYSGLRNKFCIL